MEDYKEFDREMLENALKSGLNLNECSEDDLNSILLKTDKEIEEELDLEDCTLDLVALGAPYKIGPLNFNMVLGNLALLHVIDSPFISELEEGQDLTFDQCCESLYVLYKGKDAVEPIMHIQQKIKDMLLLKKLVEGSPELIDKLLDRVELISQARSEFTHKAREFYLENYAETDLQDIVEKMVAILSDVISAVPEKNENGNTVKKKVN